MLCLSQTTGYAVLALSCLEEADGRWLQARELAGRTGVPRPYLSKILHALGQHGLIRTKRGYHGGFALSAPATEISLLDVAEAVEGSQWAPKCVLGLARCSDARACPMHKFWKRERQRIADALSRATLAEMARFERRAGSVRPARTARPTASSIKARQRP